MPIYEYQCEACGSEFERLILRREQVACLRCKRSRVKRLISRVALRTGQGFMPSVGSGCGPCAAASCAGCAVRQGK